MEVHKENTVNPYNALVVKTQWITINRLTQGGKWDFKVISNTLEYTLSEKWKTQIDGLSYLKGRGAFMWELENAGKVMFPEQAQEMW